ncbi:MarR family winged helix-turn-helix transcriptional regulator [Allokutzneria oryzae]|uniref:MarR family winged helix-turn-helix transcriptional regulator n=1 Tax=Allokutzneria oryzae TaxID=1378989 RepID=A0ABV5ZXM4_9PSEU
MAHVIAKPSEPEDGPLTLYLVKQLELLIRALLDERLKPLGLTTLQYTALSVLLRRSPLSSAQLARRSFVRPQSMHEMVLALEKRGLIARHRDPDNRRVLLATLTEEGAALLEECAPLVAELETHMLSNLSAKRRSEFRGALGEAHRSLSDLQP